MVEPWTRTPLSSKPTGCPAFCGWEANLVLIQLHTRLASTLLWPTRAAMVQTSSIWNILLCQRVMTSTSQSERLFQYVGCRPPSHRLRINNWEIRTKPIDQLYNSREPGSGHHGIHGTVRFTINATLPSVRTVMGVTCF